MITIPPSVREASAPCSDWRRAYEGLRIVVTGARGFLGTNLVDQLAEANCEVVRVCRGDAAPWNGRRARVCEIRGDLRDAATWRSALAGGADLVFHLAAQTSVMRAGADAAADFAANVLPVMHLLEACAHSSRAPAVIFAGTVTQAGIHRELPGDETPPDQPLSAYDANKLAAERAIERHAREGRGSGAALRLTNLYGAGPPGRAPDRGVLNAMIRRAIAGEPLTIFGGGAFVRDYLHVSDAARAFVLAGANASRVDARHFVVGSGEGHTVAEAFQLVAQRVSILTGRDVRVVHGDPPRPLSALDRRHFVADPRSFAAATGWRARVGLREGIDRTIEALA